VAAIRDSCSIVRFYALAFAISWAGYLPFFLLKHPGPLWLGALVLPGVGPPVAALLVERNRFWPGLRAMFSRRIGWYWYLVAALAPVAFVVGTDRLVPTLRPRVGTAAFLLTVALDVAANPCEEIGWRGFALPRLQARMNPTLAAIVMGTMSGAWHAPLFLWPEGSNFPLRMPGVPVVWWAVAHLAGSILFASLYNATARSLLPVTLFHFSFNLTAVLLGISSYPVLAALEIAAALGVLLLQGPTLGLVSEGRAESGSCAL
jgi:membrane protease YdiL (CAAX protease family)